MVWNTISYTETVSNHFQYIVLEIIPRFKDNKSRRCDCNKMPIFFIIVLQK